MIQATTTLPLPCLAAFVTAVAVSDLRSRRIPNLLTAPAAVIGVGLNVWLAGPLGALTGTAGLLVGLAAFLPLYLAGQFGGGDVKAMAAIGAFLGPKGALLAAMWILVAGGVAAFVVALTLTTVQGGLGALRSLASRWMLQVWLLFATGRASPAPTPASAIVTHRFPYGLAIACGTFASIAFGS